MDDLRFCWSDSKAAANLVKHGVSFEAATYVFDDPLRNEHDDPLAEGEYRSVVVGKVDGVILTVVYSAPEEALYRIISARVATSHERNTYEQNFFHP